MNYIKLAIVFAFFQGVLVAGNLGREEGNDVYAAHESLLGLTVNSNIAYIPQGPIFIVPVAFSREPISNFSVSENLFPHASSTAVLRRAVEYVTCCCEFVPREN